MNISDKQMSEIEKVVNCIADDYVFDIYDRDDIGQEIFLICVDLLDNYEESRGELFPYLLGAARTKLISLKRKKYFNPKSRLSKDKVNLLNATDIYEHDVVDYNLHNIKQEYLDYIDDNIPAYLKLSYLKLKNGLSINNLVKEEVYDYIGKIVNKLRLEESDGEEE